LLYYPPIYVYNFQVFAFLHNRAQSTNTDNITEKVEGKYNIKKGYKNMGLKYIR
jgi:hypothetical protein